MDRGARRATVHGVAKSQMQLSIAQCTDILFCIFYNKKGEQKMINNNECNCLKPIKGFPCFSALCRYCIFYKFKVCGNPVLSKSISANFSTAFAHFMSLCYISIIFTVFHIFSLLLYLLWWSVISELWFSIVIILECHKLCPLTVNLMKCVCPDWPLPYLCSSPQASLFLETLKYWN